MVYVVELYNIEWDMDTGYETFDLGALESLEGLPRELEDVEIEADDDDEEECEDDVLLGYILDFLSDEYGYLVKNVDYTVREVLEV